MPIEQLFKLDQLELALQVLRSPDVPYQFFPAARRAAEELGVIQDENAITRLTPEQYLALRSTVIRSFRTTFTRWLTLENFYNAICIQLEYCRHRNNTVVDVATRISDAISGVLNLPEEVANPLTVLVISIKSLDLFCGCDV